MSNKLTLQLMQEENGENYIQKDNRTHIGSLLANTPKEDLLCHMSLTESGKGNSALSSLLGSYFGKSSVELTRKAEDLVLHFPKKAILEGNILEIKKQKLTTLYPTSMIQKYNLGDSVSYSQKTPIYYDVSSANFFVLMDERFLEDLNPNEIIDKKMDNVVIYRNKEKTTNYFAITSKTIEALEKEFNDKEGTFEKVKTIYRQRFLMLQNAKRVIVLKYETENQATKTDAYSDQFSIPNYSDSQAVVDLMYRQKMNLEIFQAAQIDKLFYLMDESGEINPKAMINFDSEETDYEKEKAARNSKTFNYPKGGLTYLVLNYTEEDWKFIKNLQEKLHNLCREMESFFLSTKTELGLEDKSFSEGVIGNLGGNLLENK